MTGQHVAPPAGRGTGRRVSAAGLLVATHLVLPLGLLLFLLEKAPLPLWLTRVALAASYIGFLYFSGAWGVLSLRLRPVLPVLLIATVLAARVWSPSVAGDVFDARTALPLALAMIFGVRTWRAWRGRTRPPAPALSLTFPLRGGTFLVGQGGGAPVINHHAHHPAQRYALDILAVGRDGRRARGLYPQQLERYAIWNVQVVSPCDGVVVAAIGDQPDFTPPSGDAKNPRGNHVAIETADATIYLAHLRQGSLQVAVGDPVVVGQPLGRVGNSGNTSEPHLHVHAERSSEKSTARGVPLLFGGRFLVRNDCVRSP